MALNMKKGFNRLKAGAAMGLAALTPGFAMAGNDTAKAETPAATTSARPDIETLRKNMIRDSYENIVFYVGPSVDNRAIGAAHRILKSRGYPSVFYPYSSEQDKSVDIEPASMQVIIGGAKIGTFTQKQLFEGQVFRVVEQVWDRYEKDFKDQLTAQLTNN